MRKIIAPVVNVTIQIREQIPSHMLEDLSPLIGRDKANDIGVEKTRIRRPDRKLTNGCQMATPLGFRQKTVFIKTIQNINV